MLRGNPIALDDVEASLLMDTLASVTTLVAVGLAEEAPAAMVAVAVEELLVATRSQEGHIVKVVAGNCMKKGFELVFKALSS